MVNIARHSLRWMRCCLVLLAACIAIRFVASARAADTDSPANEPPLREIFVPFEDLHVILSSDVQRAFLTREEYETLMAKAKKSVRPQEHEQPAAVLSADYTATIEENRARFAGTLIVETPGIITDDALNAVPLDLSGVALRSATLDGKPASLGRNPAGMPVLFVSGGGRHELKLEILAPLETDAAQRTLSFQIPTPPATRIKLTVHGNVEIKSGTTVIRRDVDQQPATTFDLLPRRGLNSLVLSLNNHQLRKESVVVAHSVVIDEITSAYERLYVTASMSVLHGATEQFRFALPEGFEVTSVAAPQVARWAITTENNQRILDVHLREPITDTASLEIAAIRTPVALADWRLPKLAAMDVAGDVAVVGLLLESRLKPADLQPTNLISIDTGILRQALPASVRESRAGAPALTPVAAFYAPRGDYSLKARFAPPPDELRVTTNVLLTLTESKLEARGGFALLNVTDKLLAFDFSAPAGWQVTELTLDGGKVVTPETYPAADGGTRIHVRLPQGAPLGRTCNVFFHAVSVPTGWLDEWKTTMPVEFPVFQVAGASRDGGAVGVQSQDDMLARADRVTRLTPLDANEKSKYGLQNVATELAYRYDEPPYGLTLAVSRVQPRLTARAISFFRVEPDLLTAHYEIAYNVTEARTRRVLFALPASTPAALSIHGLDNATIAESSSVVKGQEREWTVLLGESRRGAIRLAVDFQQSLGGGEREKPAPAKDNDKPAPPLELTLPLPRARDVAYQTGMVAVEGSSDSDVHVTTALRKVDVGLLAEADYQPGRRLLGAFGYGGDDAEVKVTIARPAGYDLPTVIVERAELLTMISTSGRSQTVARFQLRSKALLVEVQLPKGSQLWSAYLDGKPSQPQREADSLLIELPATAEPRERNLQLVYETPINALGMASNFELAAPKLLLRAGRGVTGEEVPLAELVWQLSTPSGFQVVRSNGTVFSRNIVARQSPLTHVADALEDPIGTSRERAVTRNYSRLTRSDSSSSMAKSAAPSAHKANPMGAAPDMGGRGGSDVHSFGLNDKSPGYVLSDSDDGEPHLDVPQTEQINDNADQSNKKLAGANPPARDSSLPPPAKTAPDYVDVPEPESGGKQAAAARRSLWALEGVRSLPIEFQPEQIQTTFQSLGEEPRLSVTVVDRERFDLLGWCVGLLVFLRVMLTMQPRWRRLRFVATTLVVSFALPLILPWSGVISPLCNMAFYAACWLVVYYLAASFVKQIVRLGQSAMKPGCAAQAAVAIVALSMLSARAASADDAPAPVQVPPDAIIVPYDPATQDPLKGLLTKESPGTEKHPQTPFGADKTQKLLVPYHKFLELQRAAHPDAIVKPAPPADYALSAGKFTATLDGGESLLVVGHFDVDVYADHAVSIPLSLGGGVLTKADVDGKSGATVTLLGIEALGEQVFATKKIVPAPPADATMALLLSGAGHRQVDLEMRFPMQRRGGWQIAEGKLPTSPASAILLEVAKAGTEVTLSGGVDRGTIETRHDNETLETALAADGAFRVQWRAKAGQAPVDQSLSVRSAARLDVQEGGLRLNWQFDLEFRRGQRDSFVVDLPDGYLVERVTGNNVRGWNLKEAGGVRKLEVTLLKAAQDGETFAVALARRGAVGSGELAEFTVPALSVEGAAQQSGLLAIRTSPRLELRTETTAGASRADADQSAGNADSDQSPLGIVPFQVYRFATIPFTIKLSARPVAAHLAAEVQTVLRISELQRTLESRIRMRVDGRPIYRLRIALPEDLRLDRVSAPEPFEWVVGSEGERRMLSLYFAAGQKNPFDVVLAGSLGKYGEAKTVATPKLEIVDADERKDVIEQSGDIAVEADPSLDVRAEKLIHCETESLDQLAGWLNPAQQRLARLALRYRSPDYAAQLQLSPRKPLVHCDALTNVRINDRTVEETVLLDFTIREAGIRSLSFVMPESMRAARISAPMLRQKTVEPVAGSGPPRVRVRIELQEEVMGSLRVLVENDRLLSSDKYTVPATVVETGQTDHRYITLESAGRDEIVIDSHDGVDPISQEQAEWRMLTALLGRGLTQAFLVQPGADRPMLTLHAQDRAAVETAGARIGLAKATLVVDANGAYRGAQLYRVDNSLEQFLEVQLPAGARLWTAHVAGEPVKPAAGKGTAGNNTTGGVVRIPLIKTAHGDADYAVILKYGGQLGRLGAVDHVEFPLIRTVNIHVELSQVELYLPETHDWFNFGGTMRLKGSERDLTAGWLAYNTKQIEVARQALNSADPFARARATENLKGLQAESQSLKESAEGYRGAADNDEVAQQVQANSSAQTGLDLGPVASPDRNEMGEERTDNRTRFDRLYKSQSNARANDVVNSSGDNFAPPAAQAQPKESNSQKGEDQGKAPTTEFRNRNTVEDPFSDEPTAGKLSIDSTTAGSISGSGTIGGYTLQGQPAAPTITGGMATNGLTSGGATLSINQPTDQPEFKELGGGVTTMSDVQRYAGRLAEQHANAFGQGNGNGANAVGRDQPPPSSPGGGAQYANGTLDHRQSGCCISSGTSTLTLSGTNTYTGGTVFNNGTVMQPSEHTDRPGKQ